MTPWEAALSTKVTVTDTQSGISTLKYQWTNSTTQPAASTFTNTFVSGDTLTDARVAYDRNGRPAVTTSFNTIGAKAFANLTKENVGKRFLFHLWRRRKQNRFQQ